jgi:5'-nucleotidase
MKKTIIITAIFGCLFGAKVASAQTPETDGDSDAREVVILAVNDIHSAIDMFPRFAGVVDSIRAIYPDLLLLSAGDNRTGNPVNDHHAEPGLPVLELMNAMRFDASAIGNHEWDSGPAAFRNLIERARFPFLCANMEAPDTMRLHTAPYRFFERDSVRIGVLGLLQRGPLGIPDSHPDNVRGIRFDDPVETAKRFLRMRQQCDVFILLTHCGYEDDLKIAEAVPEADVIIGGHSHTEVFNRTLRNGIIITQTGKSLNYLTELKLEVSGKRVTSRTAKLIDIRATMQNNSDILALVEKYRQESNFNRVIATAEAPFSNAEELGSLMADAHRSETDADIALVNYGGVRYDTHPAGDFTLAEALSLDPFGNELIIFELSSADVEKCIASAWEIGENTYVSGIKYQITQGASGSKVKATAADGKALNAKKFYRVAINTYLAAVLPALKGSQGVSSGISATDALIEYLTRQKTVNYQNVKRIINSK